MAHAGHGHGEKWQWLGDGTLRAEDPDEGLGHIVDIAIFNKVISALVVLTVVTVAISRVDFGELNTIIAMFIASIKAGLVAFYFMHLKFEKKLILLYAAYPLILLFLLIGGSLMDVSERHQVLPSWQAHAEIKAKPAPEVHEEGGHAEGGHGTSAHGENTH